MKIIGTGSAVPQLVIPNTALESFLDTSDEWIRTRTGIEERHIHDGNLEALAADAARLAVENAGLAMADIDFLICSTVYNRFMTPALSCVIQGMTVRCAPASMLTALAQDSSMRLKWRMLTSRVEITRTSSSYARRSRRVW